MSFEREAKTKSGKFRGPAKTPTYAVICVLTLSQNILWHEYFKDWGAGCWQWNAGAGNPHAQVAEPERSLTRPGAVIISHQKLTLIAMILARYGTAGFTHQSVASSDSRNSHGWGSERAMNWIFFFIWRSSTFNVHHDNRCLWKVSTTSDIELHPNLR